MSFDRLKHKAAFVESLLKNNGMGTSLREAKIIIVDSTNDFSYNRNFA